MNSVPSPTMKPPLIREELRRDAQLAAEAGRKLAERGFASPGADPLKDALVHVFARYCEVLIERLNCVPRSHHEAFLRMLGATPAPAIPATVPLSFTPVKSTQGFTAIVPRSTQVSAPVEDESDPPDALVLFETTKDLLLVQAELKRAMAVDMCRLTRADADGILTAETVSAGPVPLLDAVPLERAVYISQPAVIGAAKLTHLRMKLELDHAVSLPAGWEIEWGIPSGTTFMPLKPKVDSTMNLTQSGELVFMPPEKWPTQTIMSETLPWLACRLCPAAPSPPTPDQNKEYSALINRVEVSGYRSLDAIPPAGAFNNGVPLDVSRDFFPLGERPRFGDVFYVLSEIFATPGTKVVLDIELTNPSGAIDSPIPPVSKKGNPKLRWEGHTLRSWIALDYIDGTLSLTQDGTIEFQVPADVTPVMVNGTNGGWIRARLVSGNYAAEETSAAHPGLRLVHPPAIVAMQVTSIKEFGPLPPERLIVESDLAYLKINPELPFNPFPAPAEKDLMLYLALSAPRGASALDGQTFSFYFLPNNDGRHVFRQENSSNILSEGVGVPGWQAFTANGWRDCKVNDSAIGSRSPRIIELQMPKEMSKWQDSILDPERLFFWLRIVWHADIDQLPCQPLAPYPRRLLLNTVLASQTMRLTDELLGSSNGRPQQVFHILRKPIIGNVNLQVHEPVIKTDGQAGPPSETGRPHSGSINISRSPVKEEWISWLQVEDFSASDSHSRHYILDRLAGSVQFGNGINGRIPPAGANNVRMHEYHTGGGKRGNRPVKAITQLHTTLPYVESVTNHVPAAGGQDQEGYDSINRGAAMLLRHRDRAVSVDDYADLAVKASPDVARAKCVPACDVKGGLVKDGLYGQRNQRTLEFESRLGSLCVIVVPKSSRVQSETDDETYDGIRPQPSFELLKNVKEFLDRRRPIGVDLTLLGPEYVSAGITAEIAWASDRISAGAKVEIEKCLNRFLHPITGGPDGLGWQFGWQPHTSDFYPLLGTIEGLDYIRTLELSFEEERPGLLASGTFLICPGKHGISIC